MRQQTNTVSWTYSVQDQSSEMFVCCIYGQLDKPTSNNDVDNIGDGDENDNDDVNDDMSTSWGCGVSSLI